MKRKFCSGKNNRKVKGNLSYLMFNARSLVNELKEFEAYINIEEPDIIVISETRTRFRKVEGNNFSERDSLHEYRIDGYEIVYNKRKFLESEWRVIYVRCSLNPIDIDSIKERELVQSL